MLFWKNCNMQKYGKDEWNKMKEEKKEQLFNQVNDIINNFQNSPENIIEYLKFNSKFHQYSNNNTLLIYSQNQFASFCASYKAFKDMGYQVLKGQKGMKILVPQILTLWYDESLEQWKKLSEATKSEKEKIKNNEYQTKKTTVFGIGTVFDIGQTDCPSSDYPKILDMGFASSKHRLLYDAVVNYAKNEGISVEEKFLPSITTRGYYTRENNSITISDKLKDNMKLSVITHELSHALIHNQPETEELPIPQKEIEADSLSLMLRNHLGITEVEDIRQDHLKTAYKKYIEWVEENKNNIYCPDLTEILSNVHNTYVNILEDFNNSIRHYLDLHKNIALPHPSLVGKKDINKKKITDLLIKNNEFPDKILSDFSLIEWYSLSSQINDFESTKTVLQNILDDDMLIVAINNTDNSYILTKLNTDFQILPLNDKIYSSRKEVLDEVYANNSIAKLVDYQEILNSIYNQNLINISAADNLKYPHILIEWSDNPVINHEDRLSLTDAENLFSDQAKINCDKGILEKIHFSLLLNNLDTYSFTIDIGESNGFGIIDYIKQHLNKIESDISENYSLQNLQRYLKEHYPDNDLISHTLYEQMEISDFFGI